MGRSHNNTAFESFTQAANKWIERWSLYQNGCMHLSESLKDIPAATPEEWKEKVLSYIPTYHCGKCNYDSVIKLHKLIVKRVLEDIYQKKNKTGIKWCIKPVSQKKQRKSKAHLYS